MSRFTNAISAAVLGGAALVSTVPFAMAQFTPSSAEILVLNQDRLLSQSQFGQRIQTELEAASGALAAENRQIETQLTEEELQLTELRETLPADQFRVLADEFDERVNGIRAAQDAKTRNLQAQADAARQRFFDDTFPILLDLIESQGASILLDSRSVLLSAGTVDITDAAIAAIDDGLGNGGDEPLISLPGLSRPLVEQ